MAIYRVMCSQITYFAVNIEAENEQEAIDISNNIDVSEFHELDGQDWQIDNITIADDSMLENYPLITNEDI
jgi:hypothetical protein